MFKLWSRKKSESILEGGPSEPIPPLPPRGPITALRAVGQGLTVLLDPHRETMVIGRLAPPAVDVQLNLPSVSRKHARIERGPHALAILDLASRNGISQAAFPIGYKEVTSLVVRPGDRFALGQAELFALDEATHKLTEPLATFLKHQAKLHAELDRALFAAVNDYTMVLHGPVGHVTRPLAVDLHTQSPHCGFSFTEIDELPRSNEAIEALCTRSALGTIFLNMPEPYPLPAAFVQALLSDRFHIRLIIGTRCTDPEVVTGCFGSTLEGAKRDLLPICSLGFPAKSQAQP